MKTFLYCSTLIFIAILSNAQQNEYITLARIDSIYISKAEELASLVLNKKTDFCSYVLCSFNDKYLLVEKLPNGYYFYLFSEKFNYRKQQVEYKKEYRKRYKNNQTLDLLFTKSSYKEAFVYSTTNTPYKRFIHWDSNYFYFTLIEKGIKINEFNIPILFTEKIDTSNSIPFNDELFAFLIGKLTSNQ